MVTTDEEEDDDDDVSRPWKTRGVTFSEVLAERINKREVVCQRTDAVWITCTKERVTSSVISQVGWMRRLSKMYCGGRSNSGAKVFLSAREPADRIELQWQAGQVRNHGAL